MSETAALAELCPAPAERNVYNLMVLKQALVARLGVAEGFALYRELLGLNALVRLVRKPIESSYSFARRHANEIREIFPGGAPFKAEPPHVIGEGNQRALQGVARACFVACFENARTFSASAMLECDGRMLHDFQASELADTLDQLELDPRIFAATQAEAEAWVLEDPGQETLQVEEAFVSLLGPHTPAFGHWLSEYLPKYVAAAVLGGLPPMPVLIDAGMPATHREALELLLSPGGSIVEVPPETAVRVGRAWVAATPGYWPLLHRPEAKIDPVAIPPGRFRPIVAELRRRSGEWLGEQAATERVFLARKPELRRRVMTNTPEIEAIARAKGFRVLYPEDLDFKGQVRVIRSARYVVAPDGSAISLTLFAQPRTKLCILSHRFPLAWVGFASMAEDLDITVLTGPVVRANDEPGYPNFGYDHHADYRIDPDGFRFFLYQWARA